MVIEWLKFKVAASDREKFIEKDAQIWTAALSQSAGFLGKEIWINPNNDDEIIVVIRWKTLEDWNSFPQAVLEETEQRFAQAVGKMPYQMTESNEYQVRKFPRE